MMRKVLALGALSAAMATMAHAQIQNELERGEFFSWKLNGGSYTITGALNLGGTIDPQPAVSFFFTDANNDGLALDVVLNLGQLLGLDVDLEVPLIAQVVQSGSNSAIIRWSNTLNLDPNDPTFCVPVNLGGSTVNVQFIFVQGALQGLVERIGCQSDPLGELSQNVHLRITPNGGDANNFLRARGHVFCFVNPFTLAEANANSLSWIGYGGGLPKSLGNVNGDCTIDDADLLQVLFNFGSNDADTDTNDDGTVDDADLLTVLFNFGTSV